MIEERVKWYANVIDSNMKKLQEGTLRPEDVINNLQCSLQELVKENNKLENELKLVRSDNEALKDAIINSFVSDWSTLGGRK